MAVLKWQRKNKHFSVFATKSMVKNVRSDTSDTIRSVRPFISDMRQCQTFHFGVYLAAMALSEMLKPLAKGKFFPRKIWCCRLLHLKVKKKRAEPIVLNQ